MRARGGLEGEGEYNSTSLEHKLPDNGVGDSLVEVADVDRRLFVLLPVLVLSHGCW